MSWTQWPEQAVQLHGVLDRLANMRRALDSDIKKMESIRSCAESSLTGPSEATPETQTIAAAKRELQSVRQVLARVDLSLRPVVLKMENYPSPSGLGGFDEDDDGEHDEEPEACDHGLNVKTCPACNQ